MPQYRTIGLPTALAEEVRATMLSPRYKHPASVKVATGYGPCRHCLRTFRIGEERRILFTYDPFDGLEPFPLPGPIFIHEIECARYHEDGGFPEELKAHPLTISGYGKGRLLREQIHADGADVEKVIARVFQRPDVDYIHVRDTAAGCYDLRLERVAAGDGGDRT
jgi:hypothetical protein